MTPWPDCTDRMAAGLRVYLRAQASGGWGTPGALDKTNPIFVVMNGDQTVDVSFNIHTGTIVSPKFPSFRLPA
jgi:hypothetical protein